MSKFHLETITPVHIGSGNELQKGIEYLVFNKEDKISVIDDRKVLKIIGEENINQWVNTITAEQDLKNYLLRRKPSLQSVDVSLRDILILGNEGDVNSVRSLKTHMTDIYFNPLIPGSSIKGAIRTAVFNYFMKKEGLKVPADSLRRRLPAGPLEKKIFGSNPNQDLFRFLRISDVSFESWTIALLMRTLNHERSEWRFKNGVNQLVEAIGIEEKSQTGFWGVNKDQLKKYLDDIENNNRRNPRRQVNFNRELAKVLYNPDFLIKIVNEHTLFVLDNEIKMWMDPELKTNEITEEYLVNLQKIKGVVQDCKANECVFRMGFGSGWTFMTGGWAKFNQIHLTDDLYDDLVGRLGRRHAQYFPKTRKMDGVGDLLGFVKLKFL